MLFRMDSGLLNGIKNLICLFTKKFLASYLRTNSLSMIQNLKCLILQKEFKREFYFQNSDTQLITSTRFRFFFTTIISFQYLSILFGKFY